jgi:hypothetical protein
MWCLFKDIAISLTHRVTPAKSGERERGALATDTGCGLWGRVGHLSQSCATRSHLHFKSVRESETVRPYIDDLAATLCLLPTNWVGLALVLGAVVDESLAEVAGRHAARVHLAKDFVSVLGD